MLRLQSILVLLLSLLPMGVVGEITAEIETCPA
jgi:hypothetical protein